MIGRNRNLNKYFMMIPNYFEILFGFALYNFRFYTAGKCTENFDQQVNFRMITSQIF